MSPIFRAAWSGFILRAKAFTAVNVALRHNPFTRGPARRAIKAMRDADQAGRQRLSDEQLGKLLARARRTRYGQRFSGDYASWPTLTRQQLRDATSDFTTPGLARLPVSTGGTTGTPLRLLRSLSNVAAEQAFLDDMIDGTLPGLSWTRARIAVLRVDSFKDPRDLAPPYWIRTHGGRHLLLSSPHLTCATVAAFRDAVTAFRPDILWITPTKAVNLLSLLDRAGLRLHVPLVLSSSERLYPETFEALRERLQATVIDYYGQTERLSFAVAAEPGRFRFSPAYGRVELRPVDHDVPVGGRRLARIISSGFWNPAMPLVRYDTGDFAIVPADVTPADLDAIALGVRTFPGISGRDEDFIYSPEGLLLGDLDLVSREATNVLQMQIVQDQLSEVVIRVLTLPAFGPADAAKLLGNVIPRLPPPMTARVEVADRLEQTALGKTPFVIRRARAPNASDTLRNGRLADG